MQSIIKVLIGSFGNSAEGMLQQAKELYVKRQTIYEPDEPNGADDSNSEDDSDSLYTFLKQESDSLIKLYNNNWKVSKSVFKNFI